MRVGFDISQTAFTGGVPTYTRNLAKKLQDRQDLEMVFFYSSLRRRYKGNFKNVKKFKIPPSVLESLFNRVRKVSIEKFIGDVDVFHSSDWTQPKTRAKKVTTYHDVVPLKYPEWSHPKVVEVHKRRLKLVEKEIDAVIAVSESTKKDLLEVSNLPEQKIKVVYEGVSEDFRPLQAEKVDQFKKDHNLPEQFILAVGGVGDRRNMGRVKIASKGYNLVILGETIKPKDQELPLLYNAAEILLYPSFYEGFGLPILEAMACGTPVITSNVSSMPEVGGDAAYYVDPKSVKEITRAVHEVMADEFLRKSLLYRGFEQVRKFSWEKSAAETVAIYKDLISLSA